MTEIINFKNQFQKKAKKNNQAGFVAAEFLFSFVLVISCGLVVFALTFSLMTVEVAQYITWSAARAYSAGNVSKAESERAGQTKFEKLSRNFPLLTSGSSNWFELTLVSVGQNAAEKGDGGLNQVDIANKLGKENRHPWHGASTTLELKLFKGLQVPFIGKIASEDVFKFNLRAFILRNPSQAECTKFTADKFSQGIKTLPDYGGGLGDSAKYVPHEDNGC